jgi:GT2 family glycosyltransferase
MAFCLFVRQAEAGDRVLVGAMVHHRAEIVKECFASLDQLQRSSCTIDYYLVDDTVSEPSHEAVQRFVADHPSCRCVPSTKKENTSCTAVRWTVARDKDLLLQYALTQGYDYVLLVDSDIILHPKTLEQLKGTNKDIIATIVWTSMQEESVPQVWMFDEHSQYVAAGCEKVSKEEVSKRRAEFFSSLRSPGIYEVGGVRSCVLMSKAALSKGVSFQKIANVSFKGEDCHFCLRATALGFPLFVDTTYPAYHIVRATGESSLTGLTAWKEEVSSAA